MTDTLWYTRCPVPTAFSLAVVNGWLDDEFAGDDITVQSLATSTDPKVRQSHFDQTQPNFFRHGGNIPPLVSRSRGTDVRLIGLSWTETSEVLLALPGSGITSAADLHGKRLSLPKRVNASIDFWRASVLRGYETALDTVGLTLDDVQLVELDIDRTFVDGSTASTAHTATLWDSRFMLGFQREESRALLNGSVDVVFAQGAGAANVQGITGATAFLDLGLLPTREQRTNNCTPLALTVTGDLLDERPDLVARVVARTLRSADWALREPDAAARIVASEVGVAEDLLAVAFSDELPSQLAVDLSEANLTALRSQAALLERHGLLAGAIDWDGFIDPGPLAAAQELLAADRSVGAGA
jgi:ABC-type nitrate/sulfonate/bicarbonate transport system substrate-binding protein